MPIDRQFSDWACSLSGCDGGNPHASIWICGIEWGLNQDDTDQKKYYGTELPAEIGAFDPDTFTAPKRYDWKNTMEGRSPYGRSFAKLYTAIQGEPVGSYDSYIRNQCPTGDEIFKLNLYPIAFNSTDDSLWGTYGLSEITGLQDKYIYRTWCFLNRFPAISRLVDTYRPRVIIGTGTSYLIDFMTCFAGTDASRGVLGSDVIGTDKTRRRYYWLRRQNGTLIVVIPFFSGSSGLNSNALLQEMGERIGSLMAR